MAFIDDMDILLTEYNLYDMPRTFYENWAQDNLHRTYMFANHFDHTNVMVKVDYPEFVAENTP